MRRLPVRLRELRPARMRRAGAARRRAAPGARRRSRRAGHTRYVDPGGVAARGGRGEPASPSGRRTISRGGRLNLRRLVEALDRGGRSVASGGLRFTHLDRVVWPESGLTKRDMVRYYARVARVMVPYLTDRALMLKRYQGGIDSRPIVQQRAAARVPDGVRTAWLPLAEGGRARRYVGSLETLLYAAQLNAIELHPWHSRVAALERPDWIVLDLDPGRGVAFGSVVRVAELLRELLEELGVGPVVKTSGSRGLHVYVPAGGRVDYDAAARFARLVAERVAAEARRLATVERTVSERGP